MESDVIRECRATLARGSKSFALASHLLPQPARDHAAVVYSFCRRADDAVDDSTGPAQLEALARLRAELEQVYSDARATDTTLAAFQQVVRQTRIPRVYPSELLAGMEMDAHNVRYDTMGDLLLYCYRVASTVGLMMCHVMGLYDQAALRNAAHLGIAMQLTNICRDVAEDWTMGRLYIPSEVLDAVGCELDAPLRATPGGDIPESALPGLARAVEVLLGRAERYYRSGDAGLPALHWRCALAIRSARQIYAAIGDRIAERGFDVSAGRAVVPTPEKLRLVSAAIGAELRSGPGRVLGRLRDARAGRAPMFGPGRPPTSQALASDVLTL